MTKYNNKNITWHNGLLLNTYNGSIYTWKYDQRLAQISMPSKTISFGYNDEGIRTKKTVGGKTTEYVLDGSQVLFEKRSDETVRYEYDNNGLPLLMEIIPMGQTEGSKYYYVKNGMGDVVALVDKDCNVVVEYTYDDYGYITGKTGSLKDTVGTKNPYRYRSYRYDEETGLYYLNARYYNPEWGRFISADSEDLLFLMFNDIKHKNLFSYCEGNPILYIDSEGDFAMFAMDIEATISTSTISFPVSSPVSIPTTSPVPYMGNMYLPPISFNEVKVEIAEEKYNPQPVASRKYYSSKKDAYEAAKKAGNNKEPRLDKGDDKKPPHYHPNVKQTRKITKKIATSHDHYYFPKSKLSFFIDMSEYFVKMWYDKHK